MKGSEQLIRLKVEHQRILVLDALNKKDHHKGGECGAGIDDKLPSFGVMKQRTSELPNHHSARSPPGKPPWSPKT